MVVLAVVCSAAVAAQNAESYVDTTAPLGNACIRTAPCQTFAEAIAKTNDGGEIRVLTIGNYGPFTITNKSITVDGFGLGYITVNTLGQDGITVNNNGNQIVIIRNMTLSSQQFSLAVNPGRDGIAFQNGAGLVIQNCVISGWGNNGLNYTPTVLTPGGYGPRLWVQDTTFHQNKVNGVFMTFNAGPQPFDQPAKFANGSFESTKFDGNGVAIGNGAGIRIENWVVTTMTRCNLNLNAVGIFLFPQVLSANPPTAIPNNSGFRGVSNASVDESTISNNLVFGIFAGDGAHNNAVIRLNNNDVWDSGSLDITNLGGSSKIETYGNNRIGGSNQINTTPNQPLPLQ